MANKTKFDKLRSLYFSLYETIVEKNSIVNDKFINIDIDMNSYIDNLYFRIEDLEKQIKKLI